MSSYFLKIFGLSLKYTLTGKSMYVIILFVEEVIPLSTIADRVTEIVNALGGNKSEFARRINLSPAFISKLSKDPSRQISDRTIADICSEFNVSEVWLRTGEGEMFLPKSRNDQLAAFFAEILDADDDDFIRSFCTALASLDRDQLHKLAEISENPLDKWAELKEKRNKKE